MADNVEIIRNFIEAWARLDAAELAEYFTDDGTYHNMPTVAVSGREDVQGFIKNFIRTWSETDWEILNIFGQGDVVVAERVDRTRVEDRHVELPCCGIFEMEDGKIKVWRDYFDMPTFVNAMS